MVWDAVTTRRVTGQRDGQLDVRAVRAQVREWVGPMESVDVDDLDLVVTEVVTNAVRHTASGRDGGGVDVTVRTSAGRVRVEVLDDGGAAGAPRFPDHNRPLGVDDFSAESGRGLVIVAGLARAAGAEWIAGDGSAGRWGVWFEM
ncbi:ATP-binding protein [Actinomadura rupiterrae]|uniref:ATP-binding protein n=1 Tax=Actinomadura rupiterrae TaxID=559627 RepID=UPI00355899BF